MSLAHASQIAPELSGVPETMLWALHNRASEAARADGVLIDPESVRIYQSIDYDFVRSFGPAGGSLAARAAEIDRALRRWIARHPDGLVISLGEGLETQAHRVDNGRIRWLSVDLPEAIRLRERFLPPTDRFRQVAGSAADLGWMDAADDRSGVFIVAQGLLMYLQPALTQTLFAAIARRFPTAEIVFDVVPRWFSRLTLIGLNQTPSYVLPPMPWGINRNEIEPLLRRWMPSLARVAFLDYRMPRGLPNLAARLIEHVPYARDELPSLVHVMLSPEAPASKSPEAPASKSPEAPASNIVSFRETPLAALSGVVDSATRNAGAGKGLAVAAGQVIARRVALGVAAAIDPLRADHAAFGPMVPEKVAAFSAAGTIMLARSRQVGLAIGRLALHDAATAARATIDIAGSAGPVAMAAAQRRFAAAWLDRSATTVFAMGMMALRAQAAAMVPIQRALAANTRRPGR